MLYHQERFLAILQCNPHLYHSTRDQKQPNQQYTTYYMIPKSKHTYNLPHERNIEVDCLHQHLLVTCVEITVGMVGMKIVFASWHICLEPDLGHIVCDKDI